MHMQTVIENDEDPKPLLVYPGVEGKQYHLTEKRHFKVENKTLQKICWNDIDTEASELLDFPSLLFWVSLYTTVTCYLLDFL